MSSNPAEIKRIFTAPPDVLDAGAANAIIEPLVGARSTLILDGEAHLRRRRLLLPPFHGEAIRRYRETMAKLARLELDNWREGDLVVVRDRMQQLTLEIILRVVFGVSGEARSAKFRTALAGFLDEAANLAVFVPWLRRDWGRRSPWGRFLRRRAQVDALILDEIALRRAESSPAESRDDILSLLLGATDEEGRPLSDAELRDELLTMLMAGHETTATALAWAVELLLRNEEARRRLEDEGASEYLDAVIRETLRSRPPVFDAVRAVKQPFELGEYTLPAGVGIGVATLLLHRDPEIYPEPEKFRPERFLEPEPPGTYEWTPFGGGRRRCLGAAFATLEMRVVLSELVSRLRLEPARTDPEPIRLHTVTLVPANGTPVRVLRADPSRRPERSINVGQ